MIENDLFSPLAILIRNIRFTLFEFLYVLSLQIEIIYMIQTNLNIMYIS